MERSEAAVGGKRMNPKWKEEGKTVRLGACYMEPTPARDLVEEEKWMGKDKQREKKRRKKLPCGKWRLKSFIN